MKEKKERYLQCRTLTDAHEESRFVCTGDRGGCHSNSRLWDRSRWVLGGGDRV